MNPLNITFRLGAVFCLLVAILFVLGWQGISHLRRLDAQMQKVVCERWTEQQLAHQAFQLSAQNSQITLQIFLLDTNAIQPLLVQRATNTRRIVELIDVLEPRLDTEKEKKLFAAMKAARTPYVESYQRALALLMEQKREAATKMMVNDVRPKLFIYQNAWNAFDQCEADEINQAMQQSKNDFATGQWNLFNLLAIAGLMAAGIASFTIRRMNLEMAVRQRAEKYLQQARELETRLVERTLQLARTNETLVETSALLEALLANTTDDIYFKDLESRFVHFSPAMLGHLRLDSAEELKGRTDFDFYAEEHSRPAFAAEQEIIRTGQPILNLEEKEVHLDGRVTWTLTSKMPWRDPAGTIVGTMGISRDITARKQAEEILYESEARFAGAFEHAPMGMALVSPDGRWLKVNRALCDLTGYAEAELLARTYQDITHADDLATCQEHVRQLFAGEVRSCQSEKNYVHRRGHCVPVAFNLSLVRDGQGEPLYLIAQIKDITERRAAAVALKELSDCTERRERMLTTTLSALNDFAYIFDREGRFLFANQPLLNLWGIPLEAAVGKNFFELGYPDELAQKLQRQVQQVFETKQNVTDETPYTSPTGANGCYEYIFSPAVAADGTVDFVVGSTRDITARKQSEETLREREERLRAALSASGTGTFRWNIRTNELNWDESLDALFGLPPGWTARSLGTFISTIHPDDRPGVMERCERCARDGTDFDMEFRVVWPDGSLHWLDDKGKTFFDAAGQPLYMTGACVDITARKRSELAAERTLNRLNEAQRIGQIGDWEWDIATQAITWSPQVFEIFGRDPRLGTPQDLEALGALHDAASRPLLQKYVTQAFESGETQDYELVVVRPDGERVHVQAMAVPRKDASGKVLGLYGTVQDITARKRSEAALRESEFRYHSLFENMLEGYAHCRMGREEGELLDFTYLEVNNAFETLTGLKNVVGKTINEVIPGAHAADPELFELYQRVALTGQPERCETYLKSLGIWFSISVYSHEKEHFVAVFDNITERKQIEEALRRQKTELKVLFDLIPALVWFKDTENNFLRANQRVVEATGKSIEEIEGKSAHEIYPLQADAYYADDLEIIRSGAPKLGIVEKLRGPDDQELWVQTDKVPYRDKDGKVIGIVVMAQDITERKRSESALLESKLFLRSTLDALSAHIAILDEQGTIVEVNSVWNRFAGENNFTGRRGVGENYLKVCDSAAGNFSKEAPAVADGIRAVIAGQRDEFHTEYPCHSPKEKRWFMVRVTRFGGDGPVRVVVAHENVSERKLAEEELNWKAAFLESMGNSTIDGILVVDPQSRKILQNERFNDLLKIPRHIADDKDDEKQLRWVTDMVKNPGPFVEKVIWLYSHPDKDSRDEIELKDGTILDRYSSPVTGKDGRHYGRIWAFRDITERKKLETQLIKSQKMETVGRLAGGIAHEFNSILTAIMGQSELLLGDLPAGSPLIHNATEIGQAAARAATLTRQLLAYGRKQILQSETLDVNRVITNLDGVLKHLMGANMDVRIIPAGELQTVKADAGQIEQVIMNMAVNARDAMPNGGKLTLETANVALDQEYVSRFPQFEVKAGDYVMLAITDTGTGMSDAVKGRLFEPFFSTKGVGQGTGLGLSTCYGIVKQSGGHISVYSEPERGTTFKIYLPQAEAPAKILLPRLAAPNLPHGTEVILLVEDDPALRAMSATLLKRLGYTVLTAANGVEALSVQHERGNGHIDLLFTDVVMPHMSGRELADRMRALHPHTKILFTSAYTENAIIHQGALDKGAALLQKPFTPSALAHKLRQLLDQSKPIAN